MELDEIVNRIVFLRKRMKLSQRKLSIMIGKNPGYINRLEKNKNFEPSLSTLSSILNACQSSFEEFFYFDINQYETDRAVLKILKKAKDKRKKAIKDLL